MDREVFNFYKIKKPLFQIPDQNKSKRTKKSSNLSNDENNYSQKNKNSNSKRTKSPIPTKNNNNRKYSHSFFHNS